VATHLRASLTWCLVPALALALVASATPAQADDRVVVVHQEEDDGGNDLDWFWMNAEGGVQRIDLRTFEAGTQDQLAVGLIPTQATGPTFGLSLGARLVFLTIGARMSGTFFDDDSVDRTVGSYELWTLGGEIGFRPRILIVEPYVLLGVGYATFGGISDALGGVTQGLDMDGVDARTALGLDIYPSPTFSFGARLTGDMFFLGRKGVPVRDLAEPETVNNLGDARARALEADGSSIGGGWSFTGNLGLHL